MGNPCELGNSSLIIGLIPISHRLIASEAFILLKKSCQSQLYLAKLAINRTCRFKEHRNYVIRRRMLNSDILDNISESPATREHLAEETVYSKPTTSSLYLFTCLSWEDQADHTRFHIFKRSLSILADPYQSPYNESQLRVQQ
jgi:hypothetical protein